MYKKVIIAILKLTPDIIIKFLFPVKFLNMPIYNKYIRIEDSVAKKSFHMFLREDSFMEKLIFSKGLYGEWEKESLKIWALLSQKSQIIIDVGANTGIYSLLAHINNAEAKIIAIEPVDINFDVLTQNIKKNRAPILAEKIALSDKEGRAKMFMLKDKLNYMTSVNDNRYAQNPGVKEDEVVEIDVNIKPAQFIIDKYNLNNIDLIKIDVEGHEPNVVKAMLPFLQKFKPNILIEIIGSGNASLLDDMFKTIGYKYVCIDEKNKSVEVDKLWDNDHHNFLITNSDTIQFLRSIHLVV